VYADFWAALASFIIRTSPSATTEKGFQSKLSQDQDKKAMRLLERFSIWRRDQEDAEKSSKAFEAIHDLFWSLFATNYNKSSETDFNDPSYQFLLSYLLNSNGQVMHPGNITPILSKMQYVMRMTYFTQCHKQSVQTNRPILE
jgi:hypothetical protein